MIPESIANAISRFSIAIQNDRHGGQYEEEALHAAIADAISAAASKAANDARAERAAQEKYNGWTNYATWRIHLECWDGYDWTDERGQFDTESDLARYLEERTDEFI